MRILVLGDAMEDRYIIGRTTRTNPEGDWPLVTVDEILEFPGGAANVERNLQNLGAITLLADGWGEIVKSRLLLVDRVIFRFDVGHVQSLIRKKWDLDELGNVHLGVNSAASWDAIIVSDYGKGSVDDELAEWVRGLHQPTFVDCKVRPDRWASWVDAVFPNAAEYEAHRGIYDGARMVVVKKGKLGADVMLDGCLALAGRSHADESKVKNVAGAGDTVVAAFVVAALAFGKPFQLRSTVNSCLRFAMKAAALAVEQPYTYAPTIDEIERAFGVTETEVRIREAMRSVRTATP